MSINFIDAVIPRGSIRQVDPWILIDPQTIANLFIVSGGSGLGIVAASRQERLSTAAAIVGLGFPVFCFGLGVAADNPELLQGAVIELGSFIAGYFGMTLARRKR